jgi:glycosyltransferase involved in cell wall biosynthesis/O-antigen/teichoic acid export membrane protein
VGERRHVATHIRSANELLTRGLATRARGRARTLSSNGVLAFSRETGLLLVAVGLLNGSNYLFHLVVSRQLGPSDYGALAALLAVLLVLSVPLGVLQTVVAQRSASLRAQGRSADDVGLFATALTSRVLRVSLALSVLTLFLAAPALTVFLDVGFASTSLLAPYVLFGAMAAIPLGVLQGEMRFGAFAVVVLVGVVARLASGIGLVELGFGVPGAMVASSVGVSASLVVGVWFIGMHRARHATTHGWHGSIRADLRFALVGLTSFWLLAQADIALARHYLEPEEAGFYSSAGLLARALLFMPAAVAFVAFPRFVAAREHGEGASHWLRTSLLASAALVLAMFAVLVPLRNVLVEWTFGPEYLPAASLLPLLAVAMAALGLVGLLTYFHVAMGSSAYVIAIAAIALEIVLVAFFHATGEQIATVVAGVAVGTLLAQYGAARSLARWRPPLQQALQGGGAPPLTTAPTIELSVVLPCHNVGSGLRRMLEVLSQELEDLDSHEIIVVSDGSTDETLGIAEEYASEHVRVLHYPDRGGKGHALHVGLTDARGRYVAFMDADGDISPDAIRPFLTIMELYEPDVVLGSKRHPLSEVHYPPLRRLMSWTYHRLTSLLFRVNVRDTQTGMKLVRREVLSAVLPRLYEKRYAFDLELLVVARSLGYTRVFEAPIRIDFRFSSQIGASSVLRVALDTAAIFYRHYVLGSYRSDGRSVSALAVTGPVPSGSSNGRHGPERNGKLRILFLNWRDITNPEAGGAEVVTHEVARRWVEWGHDVTLLTSRFADSADSEVLDGVRIRRLGNLRNGTFHLLVQRELARLRGFDVIIDEINTAPFLTPLWRRRLPPIVGFIHQLADDVLDAELPRPLAAVGRWLEPRALRLYRDVPVVTVSNSTKEDLDRIGLEHVSVIPDGLDEPPALNGVTKEDRPTLLFVGRLALNKRPHHAIEAYGHVRRDLPDAQLWIVGQGPLERELAADLPDGVDLLGFLPRQELYERMRRAHCLLVPSVREGWGLVVLEANSVGTPAIAYDVPGLRDSVRHGVTGRLVGAGDPEDLAIAALELLEDGDAYAEMSRNALAWSDRFSWNETARQLFEIVEEAPRSVS